MASSVVLLTRPVEDSEASAEALAGLGVESIIAPLIEIEHRDEKPALDGVQAILVTSANGIRALASQTKVRDLPVFAVGDATTRAAAGLGFETVESAGGDVDDLASLVRQKLDPGAGRLLHPAGTAMAGDLAARLTRARYKVRRYVAYAARAVATLPAVAERALIDRRADAVLLYSPRTAEIFSRLVARAGVEEECRLLDALCLSDAVSRGLMSLEFRDIRVAEQPRQEALFDLIADRPEKTP